MAAACPALLLGVMRKLVLLSTCATVAATVPFIFRFLWYPQLLINPQRPS